MFVQKGKGSDQMKKKSGQRVSLSFSNHTRGILLMTASSALFATGGILLKYIEWNPLAINGVRSFFGLLTIGLFMLLRHCRIVWNKTTAFGALSYMCMTTLFVAANKMTSAANAIVLQYTCPVWIILLQWILLKKAPVKRQLVTMFFVMAGILCFFWSSFSAGGMTGDFLAVISGIFYAVLFMINSLPGGDALSSVFLGMLASFVCMAPVSLHASWSFQSLTVLVLLGVLQVGLAYICFSLATSKVRPLEASLINGIEPVLNPLLVALFWHEGLNGWQIAGAAIVIVFVLADSLGEIFHLQYAERFVQKRKRRLT